MLGSHIFFNAVGTQLPDIAANVYARLVKGVTEKIAGVAAGQTVPHAHIHVIPRHIGDVADPTGGIRAIVSPRKARYWERS